MTSTNRIDMLRKSNSLVGIDFVRISLNQLELSVFLHHKSPLPVSLLNKLNAIRPEQIQITAVGRVLPSQVLVLNHPRVDIENGRRIVRFQVVQPGGFGRYRLSIDHPAFDKFLNNVEFSFKVSCSTDLDCAEATPICATNDRVDFPVDYRARDFWSFRQALLDFAAQRYPDWQDRLEADFGMVFVEMLSALGDEFAYAQDRIAREVHFDTASQRRSLRHLARLVDYQVDNGSGAHVWLNVTANKDGVVLGGTRVGDVDGRFVFEVGKGLRDIGKIFEVSDKRNELHPYIWDEDVACLPAGSTSLWLKEHSAAQFAADANIDPDGKWIMLATYPTSPDQPERRLMVRVPRKNGASETTDPLNGSSAITKISWEQPTPSDLDLTTLLVHGNMLPATSGKTESTKFRIGPPENPADQDAKLPQVIERVGANGSLSYAKDLPDEASPRVKYLFSLPESANIPLVWLPSPDAPDVSCPEIALVCRGDNDPWYWLPALIGVKPASATAKVYALEDGFYRRLFGVERSVMAFEFHDYAANAGTAIRFGDGEFGSAPSDGKVFEVQYRLGNGRLMNVAANTLTKFIVKKPDVVDLITNPLPAEGGRDPETDEAVRFNAPEAFRTDTCRAVRLEDFNEIVQRDLSWVQRSGSVMRWTGSWPTVFVTPDPYEEIGLSPQHRQELERLTDRVRQAAREVKVLDPQYAKIDLEIHVCVAPYAYSGEVEAAVLTALFGDREKIGFFDPDNFSFGMPLSRAALMATIQRVPGVQAVGDMYVSRRGRFDKRLFDALMLSVGMNEVVQVANNRLFPEYGAVTLIMEGGA